jgi:hypothetical protein
MRQSRESLGRKAKRGKGIGMPYVFDLALLGTRYKGARYRHTTKATFTFPGAQTTSGRATLSHRVLGSIFIASLMLARNVPKFGLQLPLDDIFHVAGMHSRILRHGRDHLWS